MEFGEYQIEARQTAIYPRQIALAYLGLGLAGEAGEVANLLKKLYRDGDGQPTPEQLEALAAEFGDCLWYIAMLCEETGLWLNEVAHGNLDKLAERARKGTLKGSGDYR